jgi:hypothetical protein
VGLLRRWYYYDLLDELSRALTGWEKTIVAYTQDVHLSLPTGRLFSFSPGLEARIDN